MTDRTKLPQFKHIMIAWRFDNGYMRETKVIEYSNNREHLEYLLDRKQCKELKAQGYEISIYTIA